MSLEAGLVDANILVYAVDPASTRHAVSRGLLEAAENPPTVLYVTSQVLCEFYSIVTNPRRVGVALSPADAYSVISELLELPGIYVLPKSCAVTGWMALLKRRPVKAAGVLRLTTCRDDAS